ncbi:sodium/mannose cotransporter SLC5A10-like [Watersipora subatra]|uniref:sodium/mannose cotransporter SLC5A10-like n=1 Tax=Watersipora subatra TaxID=2589382 RepID=UPI00355ADA0D
MTKALRPGDIAAIVIYFAIIIAVGIWSTLRRGKGTAAGYFLAGRQMTWLPIGASVFASNIGVPMFVGLGGSAAAGGIAVTTFEWHAVLMIILLAWFFLPVYLSSGCTTMPEFIKRRFGGRRLNTLLSLQTLILYILVYLSGQMYAGALFIKYLLGWNIYLSSLVLLILTAISTIAGGLRTVMWTDTVQSGIIIIGATTVTVFSLIEVGGWESLQNRFFTAAAEGVIETHTRFGNWSCAYPREDSLHLWRNAVTGDLPWPGMMFGLTAIAMFVWCNDQIMVQRTLASKNLLEAKKGAVFASFLKLTGFGLFIIPGMASRVMYPDLVACGTPETCYEQCGNRLGCSNYAYPHLVLTILPHGATGVLIAALMSALMSTLTSILNSGSSIFTLNLWPMCRPKATKSEQMIVGRLFVLLLSGITIAWLPILEAAGEAQLWNYVQALTSYLAPPCAMCFLLAVSWTRMSEQGAFWGLLIGLLVGIVRLVLDFIYPAPICGSGEPDTRPSVLYKVHYLHFAILLSGICVATTVCISLVTKPRAAKQLHRLTWWTRNSPELPDLSEENSDAVSENTQSNEGEHNDEESESPETMKSKILFWFCGIHLHKKKSQVTEGDDKNFIDATLNEGTTLKKNLINFGACTVLTLTFFLFGFFG